MYSLIRRNQTHWRLGVLIFLVTFAVAAADAQQAGLGWPRTISSDGTRIEVYQPQSDQWENGKLENRVALIVTEKATGESAYGTAWLSARTTLDQEKRTVTLYDIEVKKVVFPSAGAKEPEYVASATRALQQWQLTMALDRLLADIAIAQNEEKSAGDALNTTPPHIFVRDNPAVLILIDGEPVLRKVPDTKFMRVINTPAMIVLEPDSGRYFLRGEGYWMTAEDIHGPWTKALNPPGSLEKLLEQAQPSTGAASQGGAPPEVIVSTEPAELIQLRGDAQFSPIEGTRLLYVTNTDSDLFMSLAQQRYYVLLSGRWFSAPAMGGPWEFVAGSALPVDFSRIPDGHPKSAVLASVPGTPEARDAVVAAQVPQTAVVDRKKATFTATYDGDPQFKRIEGTEMSYAVNSPNDIIKARGKYYAVSDGVWFVAQSPLGPWSVCDYVPPEIYSIPPTVPVYNVKYVHVYDSTPDWVYVGYTPGYFGAYVWNGVVMFGTGFSYPGWYGSYYFGWPWTWGFGFHYAYWGGGFYWRPWYPYRWYWHGVGYPHGAPLWWNSRVLYNRSLVRYPNQVVRGPLTVYDRWKSPAVVNRQPVPLRSPGRIAVRPQVTQQRPGAPRPGEQRRDLYAGRDGQVYSHRTDGWYRRDGRTWEKVSPRVPSARTQQPQAMPQGRPQVTQPPSARGYNYGELERNRQARIQGQNRVNQYRTMSPPARTTSPPPRMSAPPPRMSAPRMPAPRMSAPRPSAPRSGPRR